MSLLCRAASILSRSKWISHFVALMLVRMSVLTLVRHGQASYMSEDYDRLSPIGEEQARKLGEFWVRHRIQFDVCFHGPARRHTRTAEIAAECREGRFVLAGSEMVPDLDEFDAFRMVRC